MLPEPRRPTHLSPLALLCLKTLAPGATRARLSIESHLTRLARLRPLDGIDNAEELQAALSLRQFFAREVLDALVD